MLAKVWKKLLLAICIIACIYNIMAKLVNRTSLEVNLKSVLGGKSISASIKKEDTSDAINESILKNENDIIKDFKKEATNNNYNEEIIEEETSEEENEDEGNTDFVVIY